MCLPPEIKKVEIIFLVLLSISQLFCSEKIVSPENQMRTGDTYRIKRLTHSQTINVGDLALTEWGDSFVVMEIKSSNASERQWESIRGRPPTPVAQNDIEITVYMARDNSYWYIALDASDDKVLPSPSPYPYSGDCLEVFFAGKELESPVGMDGYVQHPSHSAQAAFFELQLPAAELKNKADYFPEFRSDSTFRTDSMRPGFAVSIWSTQFGWRAEARIPFDSFEPPVLSRINSHEIVKMNIDYLDYDERLAQRNAQDVWGFKPDNVFCLDTEERRVNVPKYMRPVVFE